MVIAFIKALKVSSIVAGVPGCHTRKMKHPKKLSLLSVRQAAASCILPATWPHV